VSGTTSGTLSKSVNTSLKPAKPGESIEPEVERSGTQDRCNIKRGAREAATAIEQNKSQVLGYRTLRALLILTGRQPWGFAPLHPRRYAGTRYAGFENVSPD